MRSSLGRLGLGIGELAGGLAMIVGGGGTTIVGGAACPETGGFGCAVAGGGLTFAHAGAVVAGLGAADTVAAVASARNAFFRLRDTEGVGRRSQSDILRQNMIRAGKREPGFPHQAHHIVARGAKRAQQARDKLADLGIGLNDAENGVFLRSSEEGTGTIHRGGHSYAYYDTVNKMLSSATTKERAIKILNDIAEMLQSGDLKL